MAISADTVRGDGLIIAHRALAALQHHPQRLETARERFDCSPPPYTSERSGTTTRSQSPDRRTEEQKIRAERRNQLSIERQASTPYEQFDQQTGAERERILEGSRNGTLFVPKGVAYDSIAYDNVKKQWDEQGLWSNKWGIFALGLWKHEEPLEPESESESGVDTAPLFGLQMRPRRKKSAEEKQRDADIRKREREASRPYYQFIYQMSKERERLQNDSVGGEDSYTDDINTKAYENVRNIWRKRLIWNERWGTMPGMSWKHEQPWEEALAENGLQSRPVENEALNPTSEEAPCLFSQPVSNHARRNIFVSDPSPPDEEEVLAENGLQSRPVENGVLNSTSGEASRRFGQLLADRAHRNLFVSDPSPPNEEVASQQRLPSNIDTIELGDALKRTRKPSSRKPPKNRQLHSVPAATPHTLRQPKVSKVTAKKKLRPHQRRVAFLEASSNDVPLSSAADEPKPTPPRRSARIKQLKPSPPKREDRIRSPNSQSKSRSTEKSAAELTSAGKPQGVTKARSSRKRKR